MRSLGLSPAIALSRKMICSRCATPCADPAIHDPCWKCPISRWGQWDCNEADRIRGLGDVVHAAAKPVVAMVKAVTAGSVDLAKCGGCAKRREALNKAVPFE
jgi:hypothetical protein